MDAFETIEHNGYTIELHYDEYQRDSPFAEYDHLTKVITVGGDYTSPDNGNAVPAWLDDAMDRWMHDDRYSWAKYIEVGKIARYVRAFHPGKLSEIAGVGRSGRDGTMTLDFDADDDYDGIAFIVNDEHMDSPDPRKCMVAEVGEYNAWAQGEVYGYTVTAPDGEVIGSCWGFIGDDAVRTYSPVADGYMVEQAKAEADAHREELHHERAEMYRGIVNRKAS